MVPSTIIRIPCLTLALLLTSAALLLAQEPKNSFYDVQLSKEDVYAYKGLKFSGDYTSFESSGGHLVLGRTEAGVTVVILLGEGTLSIAAPETAQDKAKTVFGNYPLQVGYKTSYIRLNPKEFEETFGKLELTKNPDEAVLAKAREIYDQKFLASYHAGPKAIIPPYKTRVFEFETSEFGQVTTEEGYWLILRRLSPYGSVYPSKFVNPKQK